MEHPVIYSPGRTGMSILAEINGLQSAIGNSSVRIAVVDIGKSGSGLCDKCEPFMIVMDDYAAYSPEKENPDDR